MAYKFRNLKAVLKNHSTDLFDIVVTDVDGTIAYDTPDKGLAFGPGNREIFKKIATTTDTHVMILTGRNIGSAIGIARELGIPKEKMIIGANNGSAIYYGKQDLLIMENLLSRKETQAVLDTIKETGVLVYFVTNELNDVVIGLPGTQEEVNKRFNPSFRNDFSPLSDKELVQTEIIGGYVWGSPEEIVCFRELLAEKAHFEITGTSPTFIQFSHGNKLSALFYITQEFLKIKRERVLGFGDGENDIPWFSYYPHCVAVANAIPALKPFAWMETDNVRDGGVANFLKKTGF